MPDIDFAFLADGAVDLDEDVLGDDRLDGGLALDRDRLDAGLA